MRLAHCYLTGQDQHQVGRELLRQLYLEETGQELPAIRVLAGGKPCFESGPYHFSITHTRHHVFCVLSEKPVGIDAEELGRAVRPSVPPRALSPAELAQYEAAPDRQRAFLTFWVLKEALAKCLGTGLLGFPNHTSFSLNDPHVREMEGCLVAIIEGEDNYAV